MPEEEGNEDAKKTPDGEIESEEGTAGEPQTMDPSTTLRRAEGSGMLGRAQLDERQKKMRATRLTGGPDLSAESEEAAETDEEEPSSEVPPTEPHEPTK